MLVCKICQGDPVNKCMLCGALKPDSIQERADRKEYFLKMQQIFNSLKRSQARRVEILGTETPEELKAKLAVKDVHDTVRRMFGDWIVEPTPVYVPRIVIIYRQAKELENTGDKKNARIAYMRLHDLMKQEDRIDYRTTKADIQRKIQELYEKPTRSVRKKKGSNLQA